MHKSFEPKICSIEMQLTEAVTRRWFAEKVLKISQNLQETTFGGAFFNKAAGCIAATLFKKRLRQRCFPMSFAKLFKNLSFHRTPLVAASEYF